MLASLLEAFEKLGVEVRFEELNFEDLKGRGGKCRVREKEMIIIDKGLELEEKIEILAEQMSLLDNEGVYLPPNVREIVEKHRGEDN